MRFAPSRGGGLSPRPNRPPGFDHVILTLRFKQLSRPLTEGQPGLFASAGVSFAELQIRRATLHQIPFLTSQFGSYSDLIDSGEGRLTDLAVEPAFLKQQSLDNLEDRRRHFVFQRYRLETGTIDFRDGLIDRESYEILRQHHRDAKAQLDTAFAELCNALTDLYYDPLPNDLDPYLLKTDSGALGLYIRSPEPLDLREAVDPSLLNIDERLKTLHAWRQIGSTDLTVEKDGGPTDQAMVIFYNGDGNQLLLLPQTSSNGSRFQPGSYALRFVHTRDPDDDTSDIDHRYDRGFQSSAGSTSPEIAEIHWSIS